MAQIDADENKDQDSETFAIIGAAMAVHTTLGRGFLERVYQEALVIEFEKRRIPFVMESEIPIKYDGIILGTKYRADFVCYGEVIVELKALSQLADAHLEQIIHYLKATQLNRGILLNFGAKQLEHRRVVNSW
jgi:GxxExxY protein